MPNFDAGHYFLTALAPVRLDSILIDGQSHSRRHLIREALSAIPTGERTIASQGKREDNPFARNTRTHFARLVVLDDVVFNGRVSGNALIDRVRHTDPLDPQPVDRLSTPFLIFVADFDAASGSDGELRQYLAELWTTMSSEITQILQHCVGFDKVASAEDFFAYVKKCQIETTMPFNDYWSTPPALKDLSFRPYIIGAAAAALVLILGLASERGWLTVLGVLGLALAAFLAYRKVIDTAQTPFPKSASPAPGSDLPTVLKALYVQRAFTDFAIGAQGLGDQELHASFGAFIAKNQPQGTTAPTQAPGIIGV